MKKRQKPILLVTLLLVFVAAAVGMNYMTDPSRKQQQQQEPDPSTQVDAPRQIDHSNIGTNSATQLAGKPMPKGSSMGGPSGAGILKPQVNSAPMKPHPDENSVTSQWYSKEHR
jgi:hypothetical protein